MAHDAFWKTLGTLCSGFALNSVSIMLLIALSLISSQFQYCNAQAESSSPMTDAEALLAFKVGADLTGALNWSWKDYTDPCGNKTRGTRPWHGIQCNSRGRVFSVVLEGMQLVGAIPNDTLSWLDQLRYLSLSRNFFTGSLPADFSRLSRLTELWADDARLSGPFPTFLTTATRLRLVFVSLSGNNLTGEIPDLSRILSLTSLDLSRNSFTGNIPALPPKLVDLDLGSNFLSGNVPSFLPITLTNLSLSVNHLSGVIPSELAQKFPSSSFAGNDGLCGQPLSNACPSPGPSPSPENASDQIGPTPNSGNVSSASPFSPIVNRGHSSNKLSSRTIVIIVVADTIVLLFVLAGGLAYFRRRYAVRSGEIDAKGASSDKIYRGTAKHSEGLGTPETQYSKLVFLEEDSLCNFDLDVLLRASAEMLGKGSFGTAYRAVLENGLVVTVKRLRDIKEIAREKFEQQMDLIGRLRHPNIVPLRAYYYAKDENLIVYEFMPGGSLFSLLHGNGGPGGNPVDWDTRLQVAYSVATGLAYLHEECQVENVAHGNLKSSNVLLGKNSEVGIADFGLVPLMTPAMAAQRTAGYRAPEYNHTNSLSQKADVYSFGVLLLELLTGRQPALSAQEGTDLPKWVQSMLREEWTGEVFDFELRSSTPAEDEMVSLLQVAMACVVSSPDQRPSMTQVVNSIEKIRLDEDDTFVNSQSSVSEESD